MDLSTMIVIGAGVVEKYLADARANDETALVRSHFRAWLVVVGQSQWRSPAQIKQSYPKAGILDRDLISFQINQGNYVLIVRVHYAANIFSIRFFGKAAEYDRFRREATDG